ncbi:MAG: nucleoside monophosphate kinase [Cyanobacteria bacterium P01_A01_bin.135]
METKQVILLAPPGVDAEAQAKTLAQRWHVPHISAAALVGDGATDEAAMKQLRQRLEQPDAMLEGWVLTGFPQTLGQAKALEAWLSTVGQPPAAVVHLKAMTGLLISRLSAQGQYASISEIRQAIAQHEAAVAPLLAYYQGRSQLETISGSLPAPEVASRLARLGQEASRVPCLEDEAALDAYLAKSPRLVVHCTAAWCGSCRKVAPLVDRLAQTYDGAQGSAASKNSLPVMKIDFDDNRQITKRFSLKGIPAVIFFKDGELAEAVVGVKSYSEYSAAAERLLA